jgi:formamidopyrimidine-DNA glycosylase
MPELPEVETIKRELDRDVVGKRIKSTDVKGMRSIRRHTTKKQLTSRLDGAKISGVDRRGKNLVMKLDTGDLLVVHLGMSGQLLRLTGKDPVDKHDHVIITFTQAGQLRFRDPRTFGEMFVTDPDEIATIPEFANLGPDLVDDPIAWTDFARMLLQRKTKLKALLMDQTFVAGIGNIYSDEILYQAGLRYDRTPDTLSTQEIRRLYRAIVETLHDAIKHRGSSLADEQYVDLKGRPGGYQEFHQVYAREGQACRRCRTTIVRSKFQQRSTYYCQQCQV